jgi:vanillate O-demethylase monooxygenase subunit
VRLRQRLYAPFTIHQSRYWEDNTLILFFTVQPMGLQRSRRYLWAVRRGRFAEPIAAIQEVLDTIREQDRAIVERQRPELLPVDLSAEMHLAGVDAAAVAYRRLLARLGIEAGSPAAGQLAARHQALSTTP